MHRLLDRLADMTTDYLLMQVEAGADAVQLFESTADLVSPSEYREFALAYQAGIFSRLAGRVPTILFAKDQPSVDLMVESGADVVSLDWRVEIGDVARRCGDRGSLQGNLDPCALAAPRERIFQMVCALAQDAAPARGHILNLGHGCLPGTPVEGVRAFTDAARALADTSV